MTFRSRFLIWILCSVSFQNTSIVGMAAPVARFADFVELGANSPISGIHVKVSAIETAPGGATGKGLQADFNAAQWPELTIRVAERAADWSTMRQLAIPVRNPEARPVSLVIRVDDGGAGQLRRSRSGIARLKAGQRVVLLLPLQDDDPSTMGMRMGPPPAPLLSRGSVQVIGGVGGAIDLHNVTLLHLALPFLAADHRLIFGEPNTVPGPAPGKSAYRHIVDEFGQYTRATWPEKVRSLADIRRERQQEEHYLQKWLGELPPRDRFGGILGARASAATGFFRVELLDGRWRLVTPEGHEFFSLGIDVVSPDVGKTFIGGREFMFTGLPGRTEPLAAHFSEADPVEDGPRHGRAVTFDFYAASLERKFGRD